MEILPDDDEPLKLIGLFTVQFATAEAGLDICNAIIFQHCGGSSVQPEIPRSLERKISFFKRCQAECRLISAQPDFCEVGYRIADEFSSLRDDRHFLIHGIGSSLLKDQSFTQLKIRHAKTGIRFDEKVMSAASVTKLIARCFDLSKETIVYIIFLLRFMPDDKLDKLVSELGVEFFRGFPNG